MQYKLTLFSLLYKVYTFILLSVLRLTACDYWSTLVSSNSRPLCCLSYDLRLVLTTLVSSNSRPLMCCRLSYDLRLVITTLVSSNVCFQNSRWITEGGQDYTLLPFFVSSFPPFVPFHPPLLLSHTPCFPSHIIHFSDVTLLFGQWIIFKNLQFILLFLVY